MKKQVVICCPTYENLTEHDKKEIYDLLVFKERLKKHLIKKNKNFVDRLSN